MTDVPSLPETTPESSRRNWHPKLNWFAAEILVVVVGVLIAISLDAAWQNRQDGQREEQYLRQLESDLERSILDVQLVDPYMRRSEVAVVKLIHAFQLEQHPPKDSLLVWLDGLTESAITTPLMRTVETLVSTGDIRLLQNDSLRIRITGYIERIEELEGYQSQNYNRRLLGMEGLEANVDFVEVYSTALRLGVRDSALYVSGDQLDMFPVPNEPSRAAFPLNAEAFLRNQGVFGQIRIVWHHLYLLKINREAILAETESLQGVVQKELDARYGPNE